MCKVSLRGSQSLTEHKNNLLKNSLFPKKSIYVQVTITKRRLKMIQLFSVYFWHFDKYSEVFELETAANS